MPDLNPTSSVGSLLNDLSIRQKQQKDDPSDRDVFMRLMLAQLKNQNPLEPQDGAEFLSQIAQFSTVEGVNNLNTTFTGLSESLMSGAALQASTMVGKQVLITGNGGVHSAAEPFSGFIQSDVPVQNTSLNIYNNSGELVNREIIGSLPAGDTPFVWDGMNESGVMLPPGNYRISVSGIINGQNQTLPTQIWSNVESVQISREQGALLNLGGSRSVLMSEVSAVR